MPRPGLHHDGAVTAIEADRPTATKGILPVPHYSTVQGARSIAKCRPGCFTVLLTEDPAVVRCWRSLCIHAGKANEHECSHQSRSNKAAGLN